MKLCTLYIPEPDLAQLDQLVQRRLYPTRAEAIRLAIKDLIELHEQKEPKRESSLEGCFVCGR